jgi:predicted nuclease of restriction endonuclease-like (RecB) superfamily
MSRKLDKTADAAYRSIARILEEARETAYHAVNSVMAQAYWQIGRVIVEQEQKGRKRADYGKALIAELARRLTEEYGKGFTQTNLWYMRQFHLTFPILHAVRGELTWTHYRLLLKVENEAAREFYMLEAAENRWSTRELERQISSLLYERLLMSKVKGKALKQARAQGEHLAPRDIIKDPYVLEFLGVKENSVLLEKELEQGLIDKLQEFLLELGRGFAFVARQKRITLDDDHFHIDLVFYNYILKCFVLVDLKTGKLTHGDIGQMDFYVRYFEKEEKGAGDNPTIGLILCSDKNEAMVRYTLLEDSRQIFASKYKLYLPTEEELRRALGEERAKIEAEKKLSQPVRLVQSEPGSSLQRSASRREERV